MRYAGFGEKARGYLKRSVGAWLNVAEGGKRAGKNVLNVVAFCMGLEDSPEKLHLIAGVTKACARLNILDCNGFGVKHFFGDRCEEGKYEGKECLYVQTNRGQRVIIIAGGGKSGDAARIKGASFGSVYITEANEVCRDFFFEAIDRTLVSKKRQVFLDLNPKEEGHWFYREFFGQFERNGELGMMSEELRGASGEIASQDAPSDADCASHGRYAPRASMPAMAELEQVANSKSKATDGDSKTTCHLPLATCHYINYGHFTVFDNVAVDKEELEGVLASYDKASAWYKRDILGLRGALGNGIYVGFGRRNVLERAELVGKKFVRMSVGVDVGGRDATVATLCGVTADGELCLIDGYYHKQGEGEYMTHERYVKEIAGKIEGWTQEFDTFNFSGAVFCESAEKMFRISLGQELLGRGVRLPVYASYKGGGVLQRIRLFCMLLGRGKLYVAGHMRVWCDAFYNARWCEKARERGEWVRVDDGSYSVDCLDSAEYGGEPILGR